MTTNQLHWIRTLRPIAAVLLVAQCIVGTGFGLLHAADRISAPAAIEAEHGVACVVMHDAARCPGCQASGVASLLEPCRQSSAPERGRELRVPAPPDVLPYRLFSSVAAPRAPPIRIL
jgi:hypothetical protein